MSATLKKWIASFKNYRFYATPYNGTLFITGGTAAGPGTDRAETLFLSLDGTIRNGPNFPTTRRDHCSVELHDGRLVINRFRNYTNFTKETKLAGVIRRVLIL